MTNHYIPNPNQTKTNIGYSDKMDMEKLKEKCTIEAEAVTEGKTQYHYYGLRNNNTGKPSILSCGNRSNIFLALEEKNKKVSADHHLKAINSIVKDMEAIRRS